MPKAAPDAGTLINSLLDRMETEKLNVHETAKLIGISAGSLYKYTFYSAQPSYKNARLIAAWLKMPQRKTRTTVEENLRAVYRANHLVAVVREIMDLLATLPNGGATLERVRVGFEYVRALANGDFGTEEIPLTAVEKARNSRF